MDLRPRLAADITGVLEKGADRVLLSGDGLFGIASNEELIDELPADITIIELRATADRLGLYGDIDELSSAEVIALQSEGVVIDGVF
jgi:hypothetical protein